MEQIQSLQKELGQLLGGSGPVETPATEAPKKRKVSAAGIARIVAATKARWARVKAAKGGAEATAKPKRRFSAQAIANIRAGVAKRMAAQGKAATKPAAKSKRSFSAAHKAALVAAAKARWAKAKAQRKTRL